MSRAASAPSLSRLLTRGFGWVGTGYACYAVAQFATIAAVAKLADAETVGVFTVALSITTPVYMLASLGLRQSRASDTADAFSHGDYAALRLMTILVAAPTVFAIAWIVPEYRLHWPVFAALVLSKGVEAQADLLHGTFQYGHRPDLVGRSIFVRSLSTFALFVGTFAISHQLWLAIGAQFLGSVLVVAAHDYPALQRLLPGQRFLVPAFQDVAGKSLHLMRTATPMGLGVFFNALHWSVPGIVVERMIGLEAAGYFLAVFAVMRGSAMIVGTLADACISYLAWLWSNGRKAEYIRFVLLFGATVGGLGIIGAAITIPFGASLLRIVFAPSYATLASLITVLMAAAAVKFIASVFSTAIIAQRSFKTYAGLQFAVLLATLAGTLVGASADRLSGVAWGIVAASFVHAVLAGLAVAVSARARRQSLFVAVGEI